MKSPFLCLAALSVLALAGERPFLAADQIQRSAGKTPNSVLDAQALAAHIDQLLASRWAAQAVKPAALAEDAEFLRRVYLDLAGRIPPVREVDDFLKDTRADKRQRLVERLLDSPRYVKHFTDVWRSLFLPPNNNQGMPIAVRGFESWLQARLRQNTPYNVMVQELLTASASMSMRPRSQRGSYTDEVTPIAFYQANELKPENLAASTSRLFLGIKLECAQCHDHPHANWTRKQFWEFAAFFSGIQGRGPGGAMPSFQEMTDSRSLKIPGTGTVVLAHYLDGSEPRWQPGMRSRAALASWLTMPDNPYFARTAANRLWANFFGIGLVEPVDEMGEENPPSHPELLAELARQLAAHGFDLKYLVRAITSSQAYQRSSVGTHPRQNDPRMFARMAVRGMTPEQLFDSLVEATYFPERFDRGSSARAQFLAKFVKQEKPTEFHTSILQALALINGKFIADATSLELELERNVKFAAIIDYPGFDNAQRIERLYMTALSRKPKTEEATRAVKYVASGGPKKSERAALADVFWALLNSAEFMLNH
jgi:hypothetical protein